MSIVGGSQNRINGIIKGPGSKSPATTTSASGAMNKYGHPEANPSSKSMGSIDTSSAKLSIVPNEYNPIIGIRNAIARGYNNTVDEKALEAENFMRAKAGMDPVQTEDPTAPPGLSEPGQPGELPTVPNREAPKAPSNPAKPAPPISTPNFKLPNFKLPKFK
jgi:hypothetical protein